MLKVILIWISLLLSVQVSCFTLVKGGLQLLNSHSYNFNLIKSNYNNDNILQFMCKSDTNNHLENEIDMISQNNKEKEPIQGYLSSDLNSLGDNKQWRVLLYIVLALLPCLFLIPFFMSRDFVPPIDPNAMIP